MSDTDTPSREDHRYPQVVRFVRDTPWAILETKLHDITEMVALRVAGQELTPEEIQARIGTSPARRDARTSGPVAIIPIYGVITPRADIMSEISGGTSIDRLQASLRAAVADPNVSSILLDVNSPGGSVALLNEMAAEIRDARKVKPVVAVANTMAASAAYQLASQATEFVVTQSGSVGSIGTIAAHDDISAMQEKLGVKTTLITAGDHKGERSPFAPLTEEAKAAIQKEVNTYYGMFVSDVAKGRGVSVETVRSDFGQGRMLLAKDALAAGMVDRIDTFDNVLVGLERAAAAAAPSTRNQDEPPPGEPAEQVSTEAAASGLTFADEAERARTHPADFATRAASLTELRRDQGRTPMSDAAREQITATHDSLIETCARLNDLLSTTDPDKHRQDAIAAFAAFAFAQTQGATA